MSAMPMGVSRQIDNEARRDAAIAANFASLQTELISALLTDPASTVRTPGFPSQRHMAAQDVVLDYLEGRPDAHAELIGILVDIGIGQSCEARAKAWLAKMAAKHAELHCDEDVQ